MTLAPSRHNRHPLAIALAAATLCAPAGAELQAVNDEVAIDDATGLSWYRDLPRFASMTSAQQAASVAALNTELGGSWRLATFSEILALADSDFDFAVLFDGGFTVESDLSPTEFLLSPPDVSMTWAGRVVDLGGGGQQLLVTVNYDSTVEPPLTRTSSDTTLDTDTGGFGAWVVAEDYAPSFCDALDGSLASCPCVNPGAPGTGCDIQQGTGGVGLGLLAQETIPSNRVTWSGTGFPPASSPTSIVIRSTSIDSAAPVVFGDGLRCVGVPLVRLAATFASGGSATHTHGHGAMTGSGTFYYQLWFRNTPAMYCTPDAFNLSNGRALVW